MRFLLDLVLYTLGILFLLIGSALIDEARGAPPGDAGHVVRVFVDTDHADVSPELPAYDSDREEPIRGRRPTVRRLENDPVAPGEPETGQIVRTLRRDRRRE